MPSIGEGGGYVDHLVGIVIMMYPPPGKTLFGCSVTKTLESLLTIFVSGVNVHTFFNFNKMITVKLTRCEKYLNISNRWVNNRVSRVLDIPSDSSSKPCNIRINQAIYRKYIRWVESIISII